MRNTNLAMITIAPLLLFAGCNGCPSPTPAPIVPASPGTETASTTTPPVQACEADCEKMPDFRYKKLTLKPNESSSLNRALPDIKRLPPSTHLDASVVNGSLEFKTDSDAAHAKTATTTFSLTPNASEPATKVKVFATTPEAAALLHERLTSPPR